MLGLYHGTTSVCAQKARLTLAEKGLQWESHWMALNGDQLHAGFSRSQTVVV
jgi:glutathione S-transferase